MKKLLVTGGAGFIGANFVYYMLDAHPDVRLVCVDSLTYAGNMSTLAQAMEDPRFTFYKQDIRDRAGIDAIFDKEKPDAVVNFAAESHVDRSIEDPSIFLQTNVLGVQVMMDACRSHGNIRFHQVSTDEVYGDLPLDRPDAAVRPGLPSDGRGRGQSGPQERHDHLPHRPGAYEGPDHRGGGPRHALGHGSGSYHRSEQRVPGSGGHP